MKGSFSGEFCSVRCDKDRDCSSQGVCTEWCFPLGVMCREGTCACLYGFYGENCSKQCQDKANCHAHGSCIEGGGRCTRR